MAYPFQHPQAAGLTQPNVHSQHILATAGVPAMAPYMNYDIYHQSMVSKHVVNHSPDIPSEQPSPATSSSSQEGDHPIGYGAFGVVW